MLAVFYVFGWLMGAYTVHTYHVHKLQRIEASKAKDEEARRNR